MAVVLCVQWCDGWCRAVLLQVCAVCQDPDSLEGNEIIYCDGCDMAVHWVRTSWGRVCGVNLTFLWSYQSCYQMEALPKEDKWLCEPCKVSPLPHYPPTAPCSSVSRHHVGRRLESIPSGSSASCAPRSRRNPVLSAA